MSSKFPNPQHDQARAVILTIVYDYPEAKVTSWGASALTSFPMRISLRGAEVWREIEPKLLALGLKPDVYSSTKHYDGTVTYGVEVHVAEDWQRPSTLAPEAAGLFKPL